MRNPAIEHHSSQSLFLYYTFLMRIFTQYTLVSLPESEWIMTIQEYIDLRFLEAENNGREIQAYFSFGD